MAASSSQAREWAVNQAARLPGRLREIPRVVLLFHTNEETHRDMLRGVLRYVRLHGPWSLTIAEERNGDSGIAASFRAWHGTGILGVVQDLPMAEVVRRAKVPMVLIDPENAGCLPSAWLKRQTVFASDQKGIGELAAHHFMERGFTHFAYVGTRNPEIWSHARGEAFRAAVRMGGFACTLFKGEDPAALGPWLRALPKPVAVFAAMDVRGREVLNACLIEHISVPDEVAVLGTDNDELICESTCPPLSSVNPGSGQLGYEAAAELDRQMRRHERPKGSVRLFPPSSVVARASTENILLPDPAVRRAVEFMWLNFGCPLMNVDSIARQAGLSRRLLEVRFRRALNRSPLEELRRVRLRRAQALLLETDMGIDAIANACGFETGDYLGRLFARTFGMTMTAFRNRSLRK